MSDTKLYLTSDSLIASAKRRAMIPENQITFDTDAFLAFANEEMDLGLIPMVMANREEYFVNSTEVPMVASQSRYPIPARAIGNKLRDVFFKDTQGNLREMTRISPENKSYYQQSAVYSYIYYYIENNNVVMVPDVGSQVFGSLIMSFYMRPNRLVKETRIGIIQNIDSTSVPGTTTLTLDKIPTDFSISKKFDFIQADSPSVTRAYDLVSTGINGTNKTISFNSSDVPSTLVVDDHVCLQYECIIPQVPSDLHVILAHRIAARCIEAMSDQAGLQAANQKLAELEKRSEELVDSRVDGSPQKVTNLRGVLRSRRLRRTSRF